MIAEIRYGTDHFKQGAGEHGRGFAVVAGEVRNLAQKSAEAAQNIKTLIDATGEQVSQGANLVQQTGGALNTIDETVHQVSALISDMANLSISQKSSIQQTLSLVTDIDQDAQSNASISEETASTSQDFNEQAINMAQSVDKFHIDEQQLHLTTTLATGNFIFARARRAHRSWVGRIRGFINGIEVGMSQAQATDPSQCELGQWLQTPEAQALAQAPSFQQLQNDHAELHRLIGNAIGAVVLKDREQAETILHNIHQLSDKVIDQLDNLEKYQAKQLYSNALN